MTKCSWGGGNLRADHKRCRRKGRHTERLDWAGILGQHCEGTIQSMCQIKRGGWARVVRMAKSVERRMGEGGVASEGGEDGVVMIRA
jgi:hypothetical protein